MDFLVEVVRRRSTLVSHAQRAQERAQDLRRALAQLNIDGTDSLQQAASPIRAAISASSLRFRRVRCLVRVQHLSTLQRYDIDVLDWRGPVEDPARSWRGDPLRWVRYDDAPESSGRPIPASRLPLVSSRGLPVDWNQKCSRRDRRDTFDQFAAEPGGLNDPSFLPGSTALLVDLAAAVAKGREALQLGLDS